VSSTDVDVEEALPEYLQRLIPFSSALQSFVDSGGMASITIGWFGDSEVGGGRISADAVADMAKMHLTLDLYLYFEPIASNEAEADS